MTPGPGARNVAGMTNRCLSHRALFIAVAFSAVVSLTVAHLIDLGTQTLGSGHPSTVAIAGDLAGLLGCGVSVAFGVRLARRAR
jgi:hypothetical protein